MSKSINQEKCCEKCARVSQITGEFLWCKDSLKSMGDSPCPCHSTPEEKELSKCCGAEEWTASAGEGSYVSKCSKCRKPFMPTPKTNVKFEVSDKIGKDILTFDTQTNILKVDLSDVIAEAEERSLEKVRQEVELKRTDGSNQTFSNRNLKYSDGYNQALDDVLKIMDADHLNAKE